MPAARRLGRAARRYTSAGIQPPPPPQMQQAASAEQLALLRARWDADYQQWYQTARAEVDRNEWDRMYALWYSQNAGYYVSQGLPPQPSLAAPHGAAAAQQQQHHHHQQLQGQDPESVTKGSVVEFVCMLVFVGVMVVLTFEQHAFEQEPHHSKPDDDK
eukprot:TRINITY_DN7150_c0_g1_i1.p3 TRINITY_DN7150_c0_g1~~TRINITY_DN7150_c0_g1_i1.p3  ORF type:complete len:159 (+),score=67.78 TRINITY_DN7150_c0_g1_i1:86-562(+)